MIHHRILYKYAPCDTVSVYTLAWVYRDNLCLVLYEFYRSEYTYCCNVIRPAGVSCRLICEVSDVSNYFAVWAYHTGQRDDVTDQQNGWHVRERDVEPVQCTRRAVWLGSVTAPSQEGRHRPHTTVHKTHSNHTDSSTPAVEQVFCNDQWPINTSSSSSSSILYVIVCWGSGY